MRWICGVGVLAVAWILWSGRRTVLAREDDSWKWRWLYVFYRAGNWCAIKWERAQIRRGKQDNEKKMRLCGEVVLGQPGRLTLRFHEAKRWGHLLLMVGAACSMGVIVSFQEPEGVVRTVLERGAVTEGDRKYDLQVRGLGEDLEIRLQVGNQILADTEVLFGAAREEALQRLFTGGDTAECVRNKLHFAASLCEGLVEAVWEPTEPQYVRYDGEVHTDGLSEGGVVTELRVTFFYEGVSETELIAIHLKPPIYTEEELRQQAFLQYLAELEAESRTEQELRLPTVFEGEELLFVEKADVLLPEQVLGVGVVVAICLFLLADQRLAEQGRKREEQMRMDYPEVILKLTVLIRAGLTIRGAWERVVDGYVVLRDSGQKQMRYIYEEMLQTNLRMQGGLSEAEAYLEFGRRTHLHSYLKLSSLLEQNLRKGSRGLVYLLETESEEAWAQRRNTAKQKGEEAGTRMLVPLFLLLALVMLLIIVPAVMAI